MLFNSTLFLVYLVVVVNLYYNLTPRHRQIMLLSASYFFYWVWSVPFSLLLVLSTVVDYAAAPYYRVVAQQGPAAARVDAVVGGEFGRAGPVQIRRLLLKLGVQPAIGTALAGVGPDTAPRYLFLHVSDDELHHRRLPRRDARAALDARRGALRELLPATRGGAHRAVKRPHAATRVRSPARLGERPDRRGAGHVGARQEGVRRGLHGPLREPGLQRAGSL